MRKAEHPDMAPVTPTQAGLRTGKREELQIQGDIRILRPHPQTHQKFVAMFVKRE